MGWLYRFLLLLLTTVLGLELAEREMVRLQPPTQRISLAELVHPELPPPPPPPPPPPAPLFSGPDAGGFP